MGERRSRRLAGRVAVLRRSTLAFVGLVGVIAAQASRQRLWGDHAGRVYRISGLT